MDCSNCRNLIVDYGDMIGCEAHLQNIMRPDNYKGFLDVKCRDKRKIQRNINMVQDMYETEREDSLMG